MHDKLFKGRLLIITTADKANTSVTTFRGFWQIWRETRVFAVVCRTFVELTSLVFALLLTSSTDSVWLAILEVISLSGGTCFPPNASFMYVSYIRQTGRFLSSVAYINLPNTNARGT